MVTGQKLVITIEPDEMGNLYAAVAYDFGKGLQSNILSHEYSSKADLLTKIKVDAANDLDGVIFQRIPGTTDIRQYYLKSKAEYKSIINFIKVISDVATQVALKVYVSDGNYVVFANKYDIKRLNGEKLDEFDLDEETSFKDLIRIMATSKNKKLGRRNEEHI